MSKCIVVLGTYKDGKPEFRVAVTTPERFELLEMRTDSGRALVKEVFLKKPVIRSHCEASAQARKLSAENASVDEPASVRGRTFYGCAFPG